MNKDRILLWNDDNHEPSVWINREFAGVDLDTVIQSALYSKPISNLKECEILDVCDWTFDGEVEDEEYDILFDWFQSMPDISEEQWNYIFEGKWNELGKTL